MTLILMPPTPDDLSVIDHARGLPRVRPVLMRLHLAGCPCLNTARRHRTKRQPSPRLPSGRARPCARPPMIR
jgi:hypothetical protein